MEKEHLYIADFDYTLITDFFKHLDRQGPCSREATLTALSLAGKLPAYPRIADIGCGTGGQTITLANHTDGHITAIDLLPEFIEKLTDSVAAEGLQQRITPLVGNMESLPFADGELDMIWAEGSIYHIGYKRGLQEWRRFIKPGGIIVVSEATWLTSSRPDKIERYWNGEYPDIDTVDTKVRIMQEAGYIPVAHYVMPSECWHNYFAPMEGSLQGFVERNGDTPPVRDLVRHVRDEIAQYDEFGRYYGYVFYIGIKPE